MDENNIKQEDIYLMASQAESVESAMDEGLSMETDPMEDIQIQEPPKTKFQVNEIRELRTETGKVFRMSDGTEQAVFYPDAVHVYDETTAAFEEVDNSLVEEEDHRYYRNGRNRFVARFSREEDTDELFSVEKGNCRLSMALKRNKRQKNRGLAARLCKKAEEWGETEALVFESASPGADMEYTVMDNGVKENIVVRERADTYRYSFLIRGENVTAEFLEEEKYMRFCSTATGEEVFCIPAPFMSDAAGMVSTGVFYEMKDTAAGDWQLTVMADSAWMNATERVFPVTIDPQVIVKGNAGLTTYGWNNGNMNILPTHTVGAARYSEESGSSRMYMTFQLPTLPRNPRIQKVELKLYQLDGNQDGSGSPKFGLYQVLGNIFKGSCTPQHADKLMDYETMKVGHCEDREVISYSFDITSVVDAVHASGSTEVKLVLKALDETDTCSWVLLYGSNYGTYVPQITMTYESTYGLNSGYRTHTHDLGRFGQGSIDLASGNLMIQLEDFAWAGNRLPVTLQHQYNSALSNYAYTKTSSIQLRTADFSAMKLGHGWKLNVMQSVTYTTFQHEGKLYAGYVYVDGDGAETYFKESTKTTCDDACSCTYRLYEAVTDEDMLYDYQRRMVIMGSQKYWFDEFGRLTKVMDPYNNHMDITYTAGRITSVTDGAGREFGFGYSSGGFLTSVTAPDGGTVTYNYLGNLLTGVTYPDGRKVNISYANSKLAGVILQTAEASSVYQVVYTFSGDRVTKVTEYGFEDGQMVQGAQSRYTYEVAARRTIVETVEQADPEEGETADRVLKTVYAFDDAGNVLSTYMYSEDTDKVGVEGEGSGIHPYAGEDGAGTVSNADNLLKGHNFETLAGWSRKASNCGDTYISCYPNEKEVKSGKALLWLEPCSKECVGDGVYQVTNTLPAGTYTFSAYLRVVSAFSGGENPGAYIRVTTTDNRVLEESEHIRHTDPQYIRLSSTFELSTEQSVKVEILADGKGIVYADGAQLERNPYMSAYNLMENGNFEAGTTGWKVSAGATTTTETKFNMSRSLKLEGNLDAFRYAYQDVRVHGNRSTRETFTLSGWAKGSGVPDREREGRQAAEFRLRAYFKYSDGSQSDAEWSTAKFSPHTEEWQFASVQFSKPDYKNVDYIRVYCDYGYNAGTAYFDNIQLVRNRVEFGVSESDFAAPQNGETDSGMGETSAEDTAPEFTEYTDKYGNALTETTFTDGEFGTIYRSFGFTSDCNGAENAGNDLIWETDARGLETTYSVDEETSRNEEVTDRCGNKTAYEYDAAGRTTKVTSKTSEDIEVGHVSYAYDTLDNMTEIVRGDGMTYTLGYNAYRNLESIGIAGKTEPLVAYSYKKGNGRLKEIRYANGGSAKAVYNLSLIHISEPTRH